MRHTVLKAFMAVAVLMALAPAAHATLTGLIFLLDVSSSTQLTNSDPAMSTLTSPCMFNCPAGDGETLAEHGVGQTLVLGVSGLPASQFEIDGWIRGDVGDCVPSVLTASEGPPGTYTLDGTIAAGGWTQSGLIIKAQGSTVSGPLPIEVKSVDINGDGRVDLGDIGDFALDFYSLPVNPRSDFTCDGFIDLADIGIIAIHNGHRCLNLPIDPVD